MINYLSLIGAFFCGWAAGIATIIFILEYSFAPSHKEIDDEDDDDDYIKPVH